MLALERFSQSYNRENKIDLNKLLNDIPSEYIDIDMMIKFEKIASTLYLHVPKTPELYKFVVTKSWFEFDSIPHDQITIELCALFVMRNPDSAQERLLLIPKSYQTPELCMALIEQGLTTCFRIHLHMLNEEICLRLINIKPYNFYGWFRIPDMFHSTKMYEIVLKQPLGANVETACKLFFDEYINDAIANQMLNIDAALIRFVPQEIHTTGMCNLVIARCVNFAKYLNPELLTVAYITEKIKVNKLILNYVPQIPFDVVREIVLNYGLNVAPEDKRTFDLCVTCCMKNIDNIQYVPINLQTPVSVKLGYLNANIETPPPYA